MKTDDLYPSWRKDASAEAKERRREDLWEGAERMVMGFWEVDPAWLRARRGEVLVVDVRPREEAEEELGCIPGSEFAPLDRLEKWAAGHSVEEPLVLVCRAGGRSGQAARRLESMGFKKVASLAGGMLRWRREGLPVDDMES